jgi:hypothetical protein
MNPLQVTITPKDLVALLNNADKHGVPYVFPRCKIGPMLDNAQVGVVLTAESDDWTGPVPTIILNKDGTWTATVDLHFG